MIMKRKKTEDKEKNKSVSGKSTRKSDILNGRGLELFERLRGLRTRLAREAGMPPYIIFSDKTLVDMCVKAPLRREEMLAVSGVGENKFSRYGEAFFNRDR